MDKKQYEITYTGPHDPDKDGNSSLLKWQGVPGMSIVLSFSTIMNNQPKHLFKLTKPFSNYKTGEVFDCFGGLVCGIECKDTGKKIRFDDKTYFQYIKQP